jgi:Transposase DDE domain
MRRVRESTYIRARTICIHTQITPQPSRRKRRSLKRDRLRFVSAVWYERAGHRKNSIVGGERIDIVNTVFRILSRVATTMDCGPCRVKAKCCPKSPQRRIPHSIYEDARDFPRSLAGTEAFERSRHDRKRVEMLFAHLKRILKLGRLRLRGPTRRPRRIHVWAIAQNLRSLAKLVARPPPRASCECPCRCLTAPLHGHQDHCSKPRARGKGIPAALKAPTFATKSASCGHALPLNELL